MFLVAATLAAMEVMVVMVVEVDFCLSGHW
jgi:hypothetical protein